MSGVADFQPSGLVLQLHEGVPRFGHSNSIALLASSDGAAEDYKDGIVAFCVFLAFFVFVWVSILLWLKLYCKLDRVGCAAGGEVVDIKHLKKVQRLPKSERKYRIMRNWRVQSACLLACLAIPPMSVLMIQFGLEPFIGSLEDIQQINDQVDSRAFRAIQITAMLQESHAILDELKRNSSFVTTALEMNELCPNFDPSLILHKEDEDDKASQNSTESTTTTSTTTVDLSALLGFDPVAVHDAIALSFAQADNFVSYSTQSAAETLYQVTDFTKGVDQGIDNLYHNDWIIRLGVVILDVVVLFLAFAIFLTKHSIDYPAYQQLAAWVLVPIFCGALAASIVGTCVFVSMAIANADFCAGGDDVQSPIGTLREMIERNGYNRTSLPGMALDYYGSDCLTEDPLTFLSDMEFNISEAHVAIGKFYSSLNSKQLPTLIRACGDNSSIIATNETLFSIEKQLGNIRGTLTVAIELTGCSSISTVLRRLLYGSSCTQSVKGLTWLWTTMLSMTTLGLIVVSLRAAFYNPVIRGRRGKRREKEFEDYKQYMSKYYDTTDWELQWIPEIAAEKKEKTEWETESTSEYFTPTVSEEEEDGRSSAGLIPAIVSSQDGSVFLNLAMPVHDERDNTSEEVEDDEDSDYDSTYSYDSADELHSTFSSASVFSMMFQKRRQIDRERLHDHDLPHVNSSNSSFLSRFMPRRTPQSMRSNGDRSFMSHQTPDSLLASSFSSQEKNNAHPARKSYLNDGFLHEESDDEDDDVSIDIDSLAGVIMSPQRVRYPTLSRSMATSSQNQDSRYRVKVDADEFEMEPLTPPPKARFFEIS